MKKSKDEETTFLNIIAYNKTAELCNDYVKKGDLVAIECYVKNNNWEDENGKHYENQFIVRQVHFLSKSKNNSDNDVESKEKDVNLELSEKDLPF